VEHLTTTSAPASLLPHAYQETVVPFEASDGFGLNLVHVRGQRSPTRGPVILVHGAGVRANIFRAPVRKTLVDMLVEEGWDVWLENWRASIDFKPNLWTLDEAALHDHPAAVQRVIKETGAQNVQAVVHCQGSTSFMMAVAAGLVPQVRTVVSNAVSLHTLLPMYSRVKMRALIAVAGAYYPYLNPQWGMKADTWRAKLVSLYVGLTHHECNNPVCKQASFTYGVGFPTLWRHENLDDTTHEWLKHEFAHVPRTFFRQMNMSVANGSLVPVSGDQRLPASFVDSAPKTNARVAFFAGELNRCFLPEGQRRTYKFFNKWQPGRHALHVIPKYAHLDIFMGKDAERDVFPLMLEELDTK